MLQTTHLQAEQADLLPVQQEMLSIREETEPTVTSVPAIQEEEEEQQEVQVPEVMPAVGLPVQEHLRTAAAAEPE